MGERGRGGSVSGSEFVGDLGEGGFDVVQRAGAREHVHARNMQHAYLPKLSSDADNQRGNPLMRSEASRASRAD
jgi:hypothetical protein